MRLKINEVRSEVGGRRQKKSGGPAICGISRADLGFHQDF
jgi:hypothetical protein